MSDTIITSMIYINHFTKLETILITLKLSFLPSKSSISFNLSSILSALASFNALPIILTTILVLINFRIFSIYVKRFAQYNELYGSIGTLLVLMLFIWLNSIILLLGFELNAAMIGLKKKCE